jgi:hypothetical protein
MKHLMMIVAVIMVLAASCNHSMSSDRESGSSKTSKVDRSKRTVIDKAEYIDFTTAKHNARSIKREDILFFLNGGTYKNDNSSIVIKSREGTIELSSDSGYFNGKNDCQVYGVFAFDIQAASEDCLYIRKDQRKSGYLIIDNVVYRDDAMPDLAACLPLYGYSKNRIEVSSIMNGYIVMPSGTYWKN